MTRTSEAEARPALAVVAVTYNSADVLPGLLDSLAAGLEGLAKVRVVVVDNASRDASVDIAQSHAISPTVIQMGRNSGYAAGINAATRRIDPNDHVLILNPDVRLQSGAARLLVDRLADPAVGIVVPKVLHEDGSLALSLRREPSVLTSWSDALVGSRIAGQRGLGEIVYTPELYETGGVVEWATGAAVAISASARQAVGEWDESFFLYSEEVDYFRRMREAGRKIVLETRSRAIHIGGEYHANPRLSALMTANRIRYFRRYHGPVSTFLFRLGIVYASAIRFALGPGHRAALRAALSRWRPAPETFNPQGIEPVIVAGTDPL